MTLTARMVVCDAAAAAVNGAQVNTNVGHAVSPTTANVDVGQIQAAANLAGSAFANLVQQMVLDTVGVNGLNTNVVPAAAGTLIP